MKNDIKNGFKNVSKIQIAKYKIKSIYSIHGSKKYKGGVRCLGSKRVAQNSVLTSAIKLTIS